MTAKNMIQEKRAQSARSRKYYDDYQVRMRSKMLKRRTKEEMVRKEKHSLFLAMEWFFWSGQVFFFFYFKVPNDLVLWRYQSSFHILDFPQTVQRWLRHSEGSSTRAEEIREGAEGYSGQYSAKRDRVHGKLVSL